MIEELISFLVAVAPFCLLVLIIYLIGIGAKRKGGEDE